MASTYIEVTTPDGYVTGASGREEHLQDYKLCLKHGRTPHETEWLQGTTLFWCPACETAYDCSDPRQPEVEVTAREVTR
jgi:hypothetical protein